MSVSISVAIIVMLFVLLASAAWCGPVDPQDMDIRLRTPLTSYASPPGSEFRAVVIAPLASGGEQIIPSRSIVSGKVRRARRVGLGLVRERASLELEFTSYELPDGRLFPLRAELVSVDNAREEVMPGGEIRGVLAAATPQGFVQGVWTRPSPLLFSRSVVGLTGASGRVWTELSLGPVGAAGIFALRCSFLRMPEPEITLPAGTEMRLHVIEVPAHAPTTPLPAHAEVSASAARQFEALPYQVRKPNGRNAEDVVNFAFFSTRRQLEQAFRAAGWLPADPLTARTASRTYNAYTSMRGYQTAPVSEMFYQGREPDFVFQKSFNTVTKRHHIRIWRGATTDGKEVWLGAATHDIALAFDPRGMSFTHKVDPQIDSEREKVVQDLLAAGCALAPAYLDRPRVADGAMRATHAVTDGRLAVMSLHDCTSPLPPLPSRVVPSTGSLGHRMLRRTALETRHYLLRGNVYYWGYRAVKWRFSVASQPPSPVGQ
jgi:hypothetical protein